MSVYACHHHTTMCTCAEGLGIANVDYYWYLNQSGTYTVDGTDDKKEFEDTLVSLINLSILTSLLACSSIAADL